MPKIIGEGEIEEIVRGKKYYIRHHLGRDKKTGKYVRSPKRVVHGNKAEARRQLEIYRKELELGYSDPDKLTVGEYGDVWLRRRREAGQLSPLTLRKDAQELEKVRDRFGDVPLRDMTVAGINAAYDGMRREGWSASMIHQFNGCLRLILKAACKEMINPFNPCDNVDAPRQRRCERKALVSVNHQTADLANLSLPSAPTLFRQSRQRLVTDSGASRISPSSPPPTRPPRSSRGPASRTRRPTGPTTSAA